MEMDKLGADLAVSKVKFLQAECTPTMPNGYIISDTPIAVDYWHTARKPYVHFFFLTHCHADHAQGLSKTWRRKIYCTRVTADLATHLFGVDRKLFIEIDIDETKTIDYDDDKKPERRSFHVTALEADHCPGAAMFLFDGWFGRILCTGDFRYEISAAVIDIDRLRLHSIDRLYLDGTNWRNVADRLPIRADATEQILNLIAGRPKDEVILLAMPQAKLGKEALLVAIAKRFGQPISVDQTRLEALTVLGIEKHFTSDNSITRFHLISGTPWTVSRICDHRSNEGRKTFVLAVTSLPIWKAAIENQETNQRYSFHAGNSAVIPYSDHSSREELEAFLDCLRVREIVLVGCKEAEALSLEEKVRFEEINDTPLIRRCIHEQAAFGQNLSSVNHQNIATITEIDEPNANAFAALGDVQAEDVVGSGQRTEVEVVVIEDSFENGRANMLPNCGAQGNAVTSYCGDLQAMPEMEENESCELQESEAARIVNEFFGNGGDAVSDGNDLSCTNKSSDDQNLDPPNFLITYNTNMVFSDREIDAIFDMETFDL